MKRILLSLLLATVSFTAYAQHFITDIAFRQKVENAFHAKMKLIGMKFYDTHGLRVSPEEEEALHFLYAYMPIADATDYPTAYHLNNVRTALRTRTTMTWGKTVPELLFRHFVLPMRVNNEPLDSSRAVFYRELSGRVKGLSMKDAILEVNHWCHERVTYEPSDARTSSPLQSIRTGRGRCGEESTFTVAALRSIGIPARQVYTPVGHIPMTTMPGWKPGQTGNGTSSVPANPRQSSILPGSTSRPPVPCSCIPVRSATMKVRRR